MSTLIRNIGILDARKATPEQIGKIDKIMNVGCLVTSIKTHAEFSTISLMNVGKMMELDEGYKLHAGPLEITKQLLEDAEEGIKLCVAGPLEVASDIPVELLQAKLLGLYLIGPASVPEKLYGAFMSRVKEISGRVTMEPDGGVKTRGKLNITNAYLQNLDDHTDLSVAGKVMLDEKIDPELFAQKLASLRVAGPISFHEAQEGMLKKVLKETEKTRVKVIRLDYHYVPGGTLIDTFTLMTIGDKTISCYGILILLDEVTEELIRERNITFEAGTIYFPKSVMNEMASRLAPGTKGLPFDPEKLEVINCEQTITNARLQEMPDKTTLVVLGELTIDENVKADALSAKIGILDNYGEITASRDIASILQRKLRQNEGVIRSPREESEDDEDTGFDNIIQNVASYTL